MQLTITADTIRRVLLGLVIGAAVGGLVWLLVALLARDPFGGVVNEHRWQAVFLDDGRVYFGRLSVVSGEFYALDQAFFVQEVPGGTEEAPSSQQVRPIATEFHQPENRMLISKDDVVLVENLAAQSEVASAIERVLDQGG